MAVFWIATTDSSRTDSMKELEKTLLTNYSKKFRPGLDYLGPLHVNMSANLVNLNGIDAVKGVISVVMSFEVIWRDERLKWDPIQYDNISYIHLPSDDLWIPPLILTNPTETITNLAGINFKVIVFPDGTITWLPAEIIDASCFINSTMFPFDTQECFPQFVPWGYTLADIYVYTDAFPVGTAYYSENGEWEYIKSTQNYGYHSTLPFVSFGLCFKRRHQYYLINLIVPIVIVDVLNNMVFLLPCESGERISFSITVLLSYVVFLTMFTDFIPRNALAMSLMCYYILYVLVGSFMIALANIASIRVYHATRPIPTWLKYLFCRCSRNKIVASDSVTGNEPEVLDTKASKYKHNNNSNDNAGGDLSWMKIASLLDRIFICVFIIYNVTLNVYYFTHII
ncbi:hypothetical protein ACJMK2_007893 [Sinanodonta woodiana]|uniref:Uncharacterized protein n=1 Tax=Sinanodonta woodiana TaxID=1069815 RepID=A0ABD3VL37_SINWO